MKDFGYKNKLYIIAVTVLFFCVIAALLSAVFTAVPQADTEAPSTTLSESEAPSPAEESVEPKEAFEPVLQMETPSATPTEEAEPAQDPEEENEYTSLALANVSNYVNVRSLPSTDGEIIGRIYNGAVAEIIDIVSEEDGEWINMMSGDVTGYIKAEYFIYGEQAADVIENYITRYACVLADRLNVREKETTDSKRIGYLDNGEKVRIKSLSTADPEWIKVEYGTDKEGFVKAEYISVSEEFIYAKSMEEIRAEEERARALMERAAESEDSKPEKINFVAPDTTYTSNEELRKSIVDYAMQFLGMKYVHGGKSLETGTDCSGFTCYIYAAYGYSISRTPAGQLENAGRSIDMSEIQPGDIICYTSAADGHCTHVALYIGNGQIIHEANRKKGCVIYNADYSTIIGIKNIID